MHLRTLMLSITLAVLPIAAFAAENGDTTVRRTEDVIYGRNLAWP